VSNLDSRVLVVSSICSIVLGFKLDRISYSGCCEYIERKFFIWPLVLVESFVYLDGDISDLAATTAAPGSSV
jgi:hypothetical protein